MNFPDYYGMLGLPRFYPTQEEIKDAFLKKVVELNASGTADPDARQELDSAYLTLSDAKKKRQYDEVLDRYLQAEASAPKKEDAPKKSTVTAYDYSDDGIEKRTVSVSRLSKKVYDFLCGKVRELTEISSRYPFTTESDRDRSWFFEINILILYNAFICVYINDYAWDQLMQFLDDGISLITLSYSANDADAEKKQLWSDFMRLQQEFWIASATPKAEGETVFDYLAQMYIICTAETNSARAKISNPDFYEAFLSMQQEVSEFLKGLFKEKEFVT